MIFTGNISNKSTIRTFFFVNKLNYVSQNLTLKISILQFALYTAINHDLNILAPSVSPDYLVNTS